MCGKFHSISREDMVPTTPSVSVATILPTSEVPWLRDANFSENPIARAYIHIPPRPDIGTSAIPSPPSTDKQVIVSTSKCVHQVPTRTLSPTSERIVLPLGRSVTVAAFVCALLLVSSNYVANRRTRPSSVLRCGVGATR